MSARTGGRSWWVDFGRGETHHCTAFDSGTLKIPRWVKEDMFVRSLGSWNRQVRCLARRKVTRRVVVEVKHRLARKTWYNDLEWVTEVFAEA